MKTKIITTHLQYNRSDVFIIAYVSIFSVASGYISVLTYEYAAVNEVTSAERAQATNILNMFFQVMSYNLTTLTSA